MATQLSPLSLKTFEHKKIHRMLLLKQKVSIYSYEMYTVCVVGA